MDATVTMSMWDALIQGGIALIICVLAGIIVKIFIARTFKGIDDAIKNVGNKIDKLESKCALASDDIIRLQEAVKSLETLKKSAENIDKLRIEFLETYQPKADFIREIQILNSQLEDIHKTLTCLDKKVAVIRSKNGK